MNHVLGNWLLGAWLIFAAVSLIGLSVEFRRMEKRGRASLYSVLRLVESEIQERGIFHAVAQRIMFREMTNMLATGTGTRSMSDRIDRALTRDLRKLCERGALERDGNLYSLTESGRTLLTSLPPEAA